MVDLTEILGVDLSLLESRINDITSSLSNVSLVIGQLVSSTYLDTVAEEVNESLQQDGSTTIGDIAKKYDLPGNFLLEVRL